jgi:hypothetical protein
MRTRVVKEKKVYIRQKEVKSNRGVINLLNDVYLSSHKSYAIIILYMSLSKKDILPILLLSISSFLLVFALFLSKGLPATFDGRMHTTIIAQFYRGLSSGELHVTWADGFGNYGMPMPIIHQQVTSYLGAGINFITQNIVVSTHIVYFIGALLSTLFLYIFLRIYFTPTSALAGALLFNFSSYRIFNMYVRGALPEFFAAVSLPLILIAIYYLFQKEKKSAFFLLLISVSLLVLTHPFLFIIYSFIFIPYIAFNVWKSKNKFRKIIISGLAFALGIGISSYYLLPLVFEVKYFYYGLAQNHFTPNQFASWGSYFSNDWYYFYKDSPLVRGNVIPFGILESGILLLGFFVLLYRIIKKQHVYKTILFFSVLVSLPIIFFTTQYAEFFYTNISLLGNIQHPWRLFSALIFIPPIIVAYLLDMLEMRKRIIILGVLLLLVALLRFPQLYTKNNTLYPESHYFFTKDNVAAVVLNPIWTGRSQDYPEKKEKIEIIEGEGVVLKKSVGNAFRVYEIDAKTDLRVVDYTFYFPGWNVYVDEKTVPIEFQDNKYRGVITYSVPNGKHVVKVIFEDTKVRSIANQLSILFLGISAVLLLLMNTRFVRRIFPNEK